MGSLIATWDLQKVYKLGVKVRNEKKNGGGGARNFMKVRVSKSHKSRERHELQGFRD